MKTLEELEQAIADTPEDLIRESLRKSIRDLYTTVDRETDEERLLGPDEDFRISGADFIDYFIDNLPSRIWSALP